MKKGVAFIFVLIVFLGLVSSYELGNQSHSFTKEYGNGDDLRGWVNISFESEPVDLIFSDSLDNEITLKNLLNKNPDYPKGCQIPGCKDDYSYSDSADTMVLSLNKNETEEFGLVFFENIDEITDAEIEIESNALASCENQFKINFLLNETDSNYEWGNNKSSSDVCESYPKNYSCYDSSATKTLAGVGRTSFCQKFTLPEAPGFSVGAWIKRVSSDDAILKLRLFDYETGDYLTDCELLVDNGEEGEFTCDLNYLLTEKKEVYLCLFANTDSVIYQTYRNSGVSDGCGFYGNPTTYNGELNNAYSIFFQPKKFDDVGTVVLDSNTKIDNSSFTDYLEDFIISRYGDLNCGELGCVVPIKIYSNENSQTITVKNANFVYSTDQGPLIQNQVYEINKSSAKINTGFHKLFFDDAGFEITEDVEDDPYELFFDGDKLFEENLSVGNVPVINSINPTSSPLGYETEFIVSATKAQANITKYIWVFDGTKKTTTTNKVKHKFDSIGVHNLSITVVDENHKNSTKKFTINVDTPKIQIQKDIARYKNKITVIESQISNYNLYEKEVLGKIFNFTNAQKILNESEKDFENATDDEDYLAIINKMSSLNIPDSIVVSDEADSITFFAKERDIYLGAVENASGETYDEDKISSYRKAINSWNQQNIETKVSYKIFSSVVGGEQIPLVSIVSVNMNEKNPVDNFYLFVFEMDDLDFKENYGQENYDFYEIIDLNGNDLIQFSTTEEVSIDDLPIFVSPGFNKLTLSSELEICRSDTDCSEEEICDEGICVEKETSKWVFFTLAIAFLLILAFVVYIILFNWYKNKYETYLFKDRNNLFNLVNYINHQKRKGASDSEIESRLKKAKWKSEQINYAMKKYYGKNTGMFALPFIKEIFGKENRKRKLPPKKPTFPRMPNKFSQNNMGFNKR